MRTTAQKLRAALGRTLVLDAAPPMATADQPADTPEQPAETAVAADQSIDTTQVPADTTDQLSARTKRTPRVPRATRAALVSELQTLEAQIKQTRDRLRSLAARVPLSTLGPLPLTPQQETKLIVDAVKVAAYNAQSWLADRLARHYLNANDLHDLLRSFAELSGMLIRQADGGLRICLQPPDIPLHRRALSGLCADLNLGRPVFPGTDIPVHYEVAGTQSPVRRDDNDRGPV